MNLEYREGIDTSREEAYQQWFVPVVFDPWGRDLVARAGPRPGDRVLDVACGTGVVTRLAAEEVSPSGRVIGLDVGPGYLKVARSVPLKKGVAIEWHEGTATSLPFSKDSFDLGLCQQGLQFFPDRPAALREMRRVLRPGGKALLSVWREIGYCPGFRVLENALERHGGPMGNKAPTCSLGDREEIRKLADEAGFCDIRVESVTMTSRVSSAEKWAEIIASAGLAIGRAMARLNDRTRAVMLGDVREALAQFQDGEELSIPFEAHILTARA